MEINPHLPPSFWDNVEKTDSCWEWTGTKNKPVNGYGWFHLNGKQQLAHRLICQAIPPGMCVLHRCDNPGCVNPDHLFFGTKQDNARDCLAKGRWVGKSRVTVKDVEDIRKEARSQVVAKALAEKYGVTLSTINQIQNHHTWKRVDTGPKLDHEREVSRGEEHYNAKLMKEQVLDIRSRPWVRGAAKLLAAEFGVTVPTIYAIRYGQIWRDAFPEGEAPPRYGVKGGKAPRPKIEKPAKPPKLPKKKALKVPNPRVARKEKIAARRAKYLATQSS